jgi:hypothetical protein
MAPPERMTVSSTSLTSACSLFGAAPPGIGRPLGKLESIAMSTRSTSPVKPGAIGTLWAPAKGMFVRLIVSRMSTRPVLSASTVACGTPSAS